jgi:hypothetical protein
MEMWVLKVMEFKVWFGGGNGNGLDCWGREFTTFGEVSDGNGCLGLNDQSMQHLWAFSCGDGPKFGEAVCGNGGRVLSGGCEKIQGGYRMVKSSMDSVG